MEKKRKEKGTRSRRMSFLELAESIQRSFWSNRWECGRHWAARARLYADIFLECFLRRRIFHGIFAMDAVVFGSKNQTIFNDSVATSRLSTWPVWRFKANLKKKRSFLLSQVFFFLPGVSWNRKWFFFLFDGSLESTKQDRVLASFSRPAENGRRSVALIGRHRFEKLGQKIVAITNDFQTSKLAGRFRN